MEETVVLERVETERGELVLRRREEEGGPVYEIVSNGVFLMASTNAHSARQLTRLGLEPLRGRGGLRVLIGGLGMGFTLQAALEMKGVVRAEVVEVESRVVEWCRAYFGPLNGDALADGRVVVVTADLARYLEGDIGPYDGILLDIDNGPTWLVFEENAAVYSRPALERMRSLLKPGGVLAVWAAERAADFLQTLQEVFAWVDERVVMETAAGRTTEYIIYRAGCG